MTFKERYIALLAPLRLQAKAANCTFPDAYMVGALATLLLLEQDAHERTRAELTRIKCENLVKSGPSASV